MLSRTLVFSAIILLLPIQAGAASLPINPGMWETTMTRTNPMNGQPTTETTTECVEEEKFDPRELMKDAQGCNLVDENLAGDTLSFSMVCSIQGGVQANMDGTFQSGGNTGEGNMNINMNMGGMSMNMDMSWTATRTGDC